MKFPLQFQIRFMGGFGSVKPGLTSNYAVNHYLRAPLSLVRTDAEQADFVGFSGSSHILKVAMPSYLAQITKTVVALIAVYVVDMLRGPLARYIRPRKTVRELLFIVNGYSPITCRLRRSRQFAVKIRSLFMVFPCKETGVSVVSKRRAQMFNGAWRFNCHDNAFTIGGLK